MTSRLHRLRWLRIAWTSVCVLAAVLLCVLWVRSYWRCDFFGNGFTAISSNLGDIGCAYWDDAVPMTLGWHLSGHGQDAISPEQIRERPWISSRFKLNHGARRYSATVPHWFAVCVIMVAAAFPWVRRIPFRYSLRSLLIATTLVAVVLGLAAWAVRG
jgi:hypothetical protein